MSVIDGDQVGKAVGGRVQTAGTIDLEEDEVDLLLPRLLDPPAQVADLHRVQRAVDLDPDRPDELAQGRVFDRRLAANLVDVGDIGGIFGDGLDESLRAGPLGGQHPALAAFPCRLLVDDLGGLPELIEMLGQHIMRGPVGGADQPEVGVAIEHAQQQVRVAGLAQGEESDRFAQGRVKRLVLGSDRPQGRAAAHDDLGAGDRGQDRIALERLGYVGHGQPCAAQFLGDQAGQVKRAAELTASRRGLAGEELEDQDRALALGLAGVPVDKLARGGPDALDGLVGDRLGDREELAGGGFASRGGLSARNSTRRWKG